MSKVLLIKSMAPDILSSGEVRSCLISCVPMYVIGLFLLGRSYGDLPILVQATMRQQASFLLQAK